MRGTLTVSDLTLQQAAPVSPGGRARLSGAAPGVAAGTEVVIERRITGAWEALARATTGGDGAYAVRTPPLARGAAVRARAGERVSPALRVQVRPRVTVTTAGATALLRVAPAAPGALVRMERLDLDTYRWLPVEAGTLGPGGTLSAGLPAAGVYRFVVAAGAGLSEATSRAVVHLPYRLRA
jgi:hypothetical protein